MDFDYSPEESEFKGRVRSFLLADKDLIEGMKREGDYIYLGDCSWSVLRKLGGKGWLCPHWPVEYGGMGLPEIYRYIVMEELCELTNLKFLVGAGFAGPVILRHGSEEQKKEYLPRIARGEIEFALGYTEPEAGSDLASLALKAEDKGDYYLLNGQKLFNTSCHFAQYHWLGVRTDTNVSKHRGISLFIVDLKTPGITIRPLHTMGGEQTNEVFYDDVKVPKQARVGEENRGWYYIIQALDHERIYYVSHLLRDYHLLVEYAKQSGRGKDPLVRQKLAELAIDLEITRLTAFKIVWTVGQGESPSIPVAHLKINYGETEQKLVNTGMQILGEYGQVQEGSKWAVMDGTFELNYRASVRNLLTRGSIEIMKNVIAQRGLGLPRE